MKTGPKPLTKEQQVEKFNLRNNDRKAVVKDGEFFIKHNCGCVYPVSYLFCAESITDRAAKRLHRSLSQRFRGLGCPSCEVDEASRLDSRRSTCTRKYGVPNQAQCESVKSKIKRTNRKRYGASSPLGSLEKREEGYRNLEVQYGLPTGSVRNTMDVPEIRRKYDQSILNVDRESLQTKVRATNLGRYGSEYTFQLESFKRNSRKTMLRRYGVKSPVHLPGGIGKLHRSYAATDSLGNEVMIQGYEGFVLSQMIRSSHFDSVTACDLSVQYVFNGRSRRYYPDLTAESVSGTKFLVEVKSPFTLTTDLERNLAKFRAAKRWCRKNGFKFVLIVTNKDSISVVRRVTRRSALRALQQLRA